MEKKFFEAPTIYVGEVNINVTNLQRSIEFYRDFLGFKVLEETEGKAVFTADGKKALLTIVQPEGVTPKQPRTTGLYHFAILLPTRADLAAILQHLAEKTDGKIRLGASDHYVSEALYFDDPDGNGIEIARDRPDSEWTWTGDTVSMASVALDAQGLMAELKQPWQGMPEDTLMGHIHLHVDDIEKARNFYVNGIGMDIVTDMSSALFASHNGYHHHIGMNVWNGVGAPKPDPNSAGLNWYSLVFPNIEKRDETLGKLRELKATITEVEDDYLVEDPAGNNIRLVIG
ncbi:VOC family protein [Oceanobacillus sp. CAU 1775]